MSDHAWFTSRHRQADIILYTGPGDAAQERRRLREGRLAMDSPLKKGYGKDSWCDSGSG
jgi:hypothetical protein